MKCNHMAILRVREKHPNGWALHDVCERHLQPMLLTIQGYRVETLPKNCKIICTYMEPHNES